MVLGTRSIVVAFEASELGPYGTVGDRGIKRVVGSLLTSLCERSDVRVRVSGLYPHDARRYAKWSSQVAGPQSILEMPIRWLEAGIRRGQNFIYSSGTNKGITIKAIRQLLIYLLPHVIGWTRRIPSKVLRRADIFHSPYLPIPQWIVKSGITAFITIYDIIPLTYPELVSSGSIEAVKRIVESIRPEMWVMCISEAVKRDLCSTTGFPGERVSVVPLAASKDHFHLATEDEVKTVQIRHNLMESPYLLSLSAIEPRKNIGLLLRCFARICREDKIDDLQLVLVGVRAKDCHLRDALASVNEKVRSRVTFTGFVPNEELAGLYGGALAFCFPSYAEGFGLPVLEAMQCGAPIISSNRTSLPEVVGDAGFLIDPDDEEKWCEAMIKIYGDPLLRRRMRELSLSRASQFSWQKTANLLVSAYRQALAT